MAAVVPFLIAVLLLGVTPVGAVEVDDVFNVFNEGAHVYVEPGAENADPVRLQAVVDRAAQADINLYVAVVANGSERVDAELLRDALSPSTIIVFTPDIYRLATSDMCRASFNAAREQSDDALSNGTADEAASAFVEAALLQPRCSDNTKILGLSRWLVIPLLVLALLGLLAWWIMRSAMRSRRAAQQAADFEQRREVLREWGWSLREPLTEISPRLGDVPDPRLSAMYNDALSAAKQAESDIASATGLPELDRAEIRIARAQMQVRDILAALPDAASVTKTPRILRP